MVHRKPDSQSFSHASDKSLEFFIPYYESLDYLIECLSSLMAQNNPNFKVTVVDDCSSDNQAALFVDGMHDARFLYVKNPRNLGLPGNFQRCVDMATSDWVVIIGQDDKLPFDYVKSLTLHLDDLTIGFIQPQVEIIDSSGIKNRNLADSVKLLIRKRITKHGRKSKNSEECKVEPDEILPWFLFGNPFYFPTLVWNRTVLQDFGFNQDLPITLDYDLIFRMLNNGFGVTFLQNITAIYRRHDHSASGKLTSMLDRLIEETEVLKSFGMNLQNPTLTIKLIIAIRPTIRSHAIALAINEMISGRITSASRFLKEALRA